VTSLEPPDPQLTAEPVEEPMPDLSRVSVIERELDDVEQALARLEEGTYGTCEVCSAPLPDDVLADEPAARRCPEHAGASSA
jgi:RNA polymerase-binding transcription factor DksA